MAKKRRPAVPACGNLVVDQWFERDRAMVHVKTKDTERTVAEWWDEAVGEMVEDGFFKRGRRPWSGVDATSVLEYLADMGECRRAARPGRRRFSIGPGPLGRSRR